MGMIPLERAEIYCMKMTALMDRWEEENPHATEEELQEFFGSSECEEIKRLKEGLLEFLNQGRP